MPSTRPRLPRALLLDLDDTIVDDTSVVDSCWDEACRDCRLTDDHQIVFHAITEVRNWFWADAERHRTGRLDMVAARRTIVGMAFAQLGRTDERLSVAIADRYTTLRDDKLDVIPGALETVRWLRANECRLALVTNGAGMAQRAKIARFSLEPYFDAILVEGEMGFGKPDERVFRQALTRLDVSAYEAWMVGDNLAWDIAPAQRLGIRAVWIDGRGHGLPAASPCVPDRIVRRLSELRDFDSAMSSGQPDNESVDS